MWDISSLQLAKLQFFSSLSFFGIFGLATLGQAWLLLFCKCMAHWRSDGKWVHMYRFWVRIFALSMTVSLLLMLFLLVQSGALWPHLFVRLGSVTGPLIVLVVSLVFVIKLFVIDIMLYRQNSMAPILHSVFVLLTALGVTTLAILLVAFQSWLNFPAGLQGDVAPLALSSWRSLVMHVQGNHRLLFVGALALLCLAFLLAAVGARHALNRSPDVTGYLDFKTAAVLAALGLLGSVASGMLYHDELFRPLAALPGLARWAAYAAMVLLATQGLGCLVLWFCVLRRSDDVSRLPRFWLHGIVWLGPLAWLSVAIALFLLSMKDGLFFVSRQITYAEAYSEQAFAMMAGSTLLMWALFAAIAAGFVFLVLRAIRFGVVPVRKIRRTA